MLTNDEVSAAEGLASVDRGTSLSDQVYMSLRTALMSGVFRPGEHLTTRAVAAMTNVSNTPAREALSRLQAEGALDLLANRSICVPELDGDQIREVYDLRRLLEPEAAVQAIGALKDEHFAKMAAHLKRQSEALEKHDYRKSLACNQLFRFEIYGAAGKPLLMHFIECLWLKVGPTMNLFYPEFAVSRVGYENNTAIMERLRARDEAGVRKIVDQDLARGAESLVKLIEANKDARSA